jgi:aarF domain-containing kinase
MVVIKRICKLVSLIIYFIHSDNYKKITAKIGILHGVPQKLAQHLTLHDFSKFDHFTSLYSSGQIENCDIERICRAKNIVLLKSPQLAAQASIGQVFQVSSNYGEIAVKIKYQNINLLIHNDLYLIKKLAKLINLLPWENPSTHILAQLEQTLQEECDYLREAALQKQVHSMFIDHKGIEVPEIISEWCDGSVLVSRWFHGSMIHDFFEQASIEDRVQLLNLFVTFQLKAALKGRIIHTDPHPGNFLVKGSSANMVLVVLDFGNAQYLTEEECLAFTQLLLSNYENEGQLKSILKKLGISQSILDIYEPVLGDLAAILLEPFYHIGCYNFKNLRLHYKINTLLSSTVLSKSFQPSPCLISLARMVHGLYHYAQKYQINLDWHSKLREIAQTLEDENE